MVSKSQPLKGRRALITGASKGIGAAIAVEYAKAGAHVILVARSKKKLEAVDDQIREAGAGEATLVPLDLMELDKIDQLAATIYERFGGLDILVSNAAQLGDLTPMAQIDPKAWNRVMTVNLTANARLIRALDPLLRTAEDGRALFVTDSIASKSKAYWAAYGISKTGLEKMVKTYAREVKNSPLKIHLVDPGAVDTSLRNQAYPGEDESMLLKPEDVAPFFVDLADPKKDHEKLLQAFAAAA